MNYTKLDNTGLHKVNGTSLRGYVLTTYDKLVATFGEPTYLGSYDEKTTCEWFIEFEDGTVATIYDWKTGGTPMYPYEWHIGGKNNKVVRLIQALNESLSLTTSL